MSIHRRFAPISGRFEPESVAGLTGIYIGCWMLLIMIFSANFRGLFLGLNRLFLAEK